MPPDNRSQRTAQRAAEVGDRIGVYVDNDALCVLAAPGELRVRFIAALRSQGTLLFSWENAIELPTTNNVQSFLDDVGPEWVLLPLNPWAVAQPDRAGAGASTLVSESVATSYCQQRSTEVSPRVGMMQDQSADTHCRLAEAVNWVRGNAGAVRDFQKFSEAVCGRVEEDCLDYGEEPASLETIAPLVPFLRECPVHFALNHLLRSLLVESRASHLRERDGLDLCHAVMAVSYARLAVLDMDWKRRVECLPRPHALAEVYCAGELAVFVERFESLTRQGNQEGLPCSTW